MTTPNHYEHARAIATNRVRHALTRDVRIHLRRIADLCLTLGAADADVDMTDLAAYATGDISEKQFATMVRKHTPRIRADAIHDAYCIGQTLRVLCRDRVD